MNAEQQVQTIQFYKIQLMQKEREISDFDSKLKKIQFRNTRQLKQAKTAQQRAKNLLKQQKAKVDKLSKQANQNQQQNNLLQMRLTSLKEQKQKEILQVRSQYNSIKQEVRSYERILPTHIFLTQIQMSINQLPTYEDIFVNLKQKIVQINQLQAKFQTFKEKTEETIKGYENSEELLKQRKMQAERNLKEVLPKIIQYQHQISDLRINNEQYQNIINDLKSQLSQQKSKNSHLQQSIRLFQSQVQQMRQAFTNQLHNKQEQVRLSFQEEMERYEQEIKSLSSRLEIKDNMYISQIHILQQEVAFTHSKAQNQREKYEETLNEAKDQIQAVKGQFERAKVQNEQLVHKNEDTIKNLLQVASENEHLQDNIKGIQKKIMEDIDHHEKQSKQNEKRSQHQIEEHQGKYEQLNEQYKKLKESYTQLLQQKQSIKQQNQQLRSQLTNHKQTSQTTQVSNNLELPHNAFQYEQKYRRKSTDFDKYEQELIVMHTTQKVELNKEKQKTSELMKKTEEVQTEKMTIKYELQCVRQELNQSRKIVDRLESELLQKTQQLQQLTVQVTSCKNQSTSQAQKLKLLYEQKQRIVIQQLQQRQKIASLMKTVSDSQLLITGNNTRQNLLKANIESLKQENRIILEQDRKNKEIIKTQKEEIKSLKQINANLNEKTFKQSKDLLSALQTLKQQKQQIKNEFSSKQKTLTYEIALLKNGKQLQEKLRTQINALNEELLKSENEKQNLSKKCIEVSKDLQASKKEIQKLQHQNIQKDQQNQLINRSLDRQRRQRTLRTVPSLQSLQGEQQLAEQQNFNDIYLTITRKEGQINLLQRQISDLKEQLQSLKLSQAAKIEALEAEQNQYIQTVIMMKMKCAESEMKASEKEYLYNQLKRKMGMTNTGKQ